ncbi:MAG: hypothetical protein K1000chlam2_00232 [Chlamydiae bacterium]|nr:hypothetical protein [Chlamydiota bacterium]
MALLILIPFIVQALVIGFDEYYFHIKRGLPLWERIGHPIDTLSIMAALLFVLLVPYSDANLKWYIGLAVFSCLMVTKDEWVHKHHCPAAEHWLHALLFINHPIVLTGTGIIWWILTGHTAPRWMQHWLDQPTALHTLLVAQMVFVSLFFLYQVIYWNFIWKEEKIKTQ